jgi:hypothetical protein
VSKQRNVDLAKWSGPKRPYDLVKEFTIALLVVTLLTVGLAALFSSPDERAVTLQEQLSAPHTGHRITMRARAFN